MTVDCGIAVATSAMGPWGGWRKVRARVEGWLGRLLAALVLAVIMIPDGAPANSILVTSGAAGCSHTRTELPDIARAGERHCEELEACSGECRSDLDIDLGMPLRPIFHSTIILSSPRDAFSEHFVTAGLVTELLRPPTGM
ncbi:hypothetical protein [Tardiphaga sp.]|uniref:hypothetical protein n=1 Tax=Tardiphaga sp. TaxID=1926292 RepID=UPI00352ACB4E